jgi:hypothetical protein
LFFQIQGRQRSELSLMNSNSFSPHSKRRILSVSDAGALFFFFKNPSW